MRSIALALALVGLSGADETSRHVKHNVRKVRDTGVFGRGVAIAIESAITQKRQRKQVAPKNNLTAAELVDMYEIAYTFAEKEMAKCVHQFMHTDDPKAECAVVQAKVDQAKADVEKYKACESTPDDPDCTFIIPPPPNGNATSGDGPCDDRNKGRCCSGKCVMFDYMLDDEDDCGDKSDEMLQCGFAPGADTFDVDELVGCGMLHCLDDVMQCISEPACSSVIGALGDASLEHTNVLKTAFEAAEEDGAAKGLMKCATDQCLHVVYPHVEDMGHEECSSPKESLCCNGACVLTRYAWDGDNDCGDGSDESKHCGFEGYDGPDNRESGGSGGGYEGYDGYDYGFSGWGEYWDDDYSYDDGDNDFFDNFFGYDDFTELGTPCNDAESPFDDIDELCERDCKYDDKSDDDGGNDWWDIFFEDDGADDDWFSWGFGGSDDDLDTCEDQTSEFGKTCKNSECKAALAAITTDVIKHFIVECHGAFPEVYEAHATSIPELVSYYSWLANTCGAEPADGLELPSAEILDLLHEEASRKLAAHCDVEKPSYSTLQCTKLRQELTQYESQYDHRPKPLDVETLEAEQKVLKEKLARCDVTSSGCDGEEMSKSEARCCVWTKELGEVTATLKKKTKQWKDSISDCTGDDCGKDTGDGGGGKTDQSKTQQDGDTPAQTNHLGTILAIIFAGVAIVACIVGYVMVQKAKAKTQAPPTSFANPGYEQALATTGPTEPAGPTYAVAGAGPQDGGNSSVGYMDISAAVEQGDDVEC